MRNADDLARALAHSVARQIELTEAWHESLAGPPLPTSSAFEELVERHHRANFDLWHEEDRARDPESADAEIARVKHAIDRYNQVRNDLVEAMDEILFAAQGRPTSAAPLHSETPGAMLDRLSILALKLFHTREETARADTDDAHRARNRDRLALLARQHSDLRGCLLELWDEVVRGTRRFALYRQLKMYNDPELNPVLYRRRDAEARGREPEPSRRSGS